MRRSCIKQVFNKLLPFKQQLALTHSGGVICKGVKNCSGEHFARIRIKLPLGSCAEVSIFVISCATAVVFLNLSVDGTLRCGNKGKRN